MSNEITVQVFSSIDTVPATVWDELIGQRSLTFGRDFWRVLEKAQLNDFNYRHLVFFDSDQRAVGLTTCYSVTTDLAIFSPKWLRAALLAVRRYFPSFLKLSMLECGTPIILNSPPLVTQTPLMMTAVLPTLHAVLIKIAQQAGCHLIVIRDFEPNAHDLIPVFNRLGYRWGESLPNTYLDIAWASADDYLSSMKSYYRSKLLKHLKINQSRGIHFRLTADFDDLAETLCKQWLVVHTQADEFAREVLTPAFYRAFAQDLGADSKVILFYQHDQLIGHALLLMDGELLRWLYFGREVAVNDSLYIYVGYAVIEAAIQLGAKRLELGLTTYAIKQDLGAECVPIKLALYSPWRWLNPLIGLGYGWLNQPPMIRQRAVFKVVTHQRRHSATGRKHATRHTH